MIENNKNKNSKNEGDESNIDYYNMSEKNNKNDTLKFYYNREERLKKLEKLISEKKEKKGRWNLRKGSKKTLFVVLIDILILALFIYFVHKPANLYVKKEDGGLTYELNISGIRGKKVMFAITITNNSKNIIKLSRDQTVIVKIIKDKANTITLKKTIGSDTLLKTSESTSVVFMIKEAALPSSAMVKVFIGKTKNLIFETRVRFYYFNF